MTMENKPGEAVNTDQPQEQTQVQEQVQGQQKVCLMPIESVQQIVNYLTSDEKYKEINRLLAMVQQTEVVGVENIIKK